MRGLPDKSVDLILTDPPFFAPASHYQSRISWGRSWADLSILGEFFFNVGNEFKRVLKDDGHLMCFCNDESYPVFYPVAYGLWDFTAALVWDKTRVGLGKIFRHQFELILWASNKGAKVNNDGKLHSDVLKYKATLSRERNHPVEKPQELMEELISVCTKEGDMVLDAFAGGGSVLSAAKKMNRNAIGIELNPKYAEVSRKRLEQAALTY